MLKITKKGDKYWLFEDSEIGLFSPSKFTINLLNNVITIVYENGLDSKNYNVIDCEIYDLGELTPFTTSSGNAFMKKLEELNCPCFQKNKNIFNITAGAWGDITGNLSNQTDLQTALDSKLNKDTTAGVERAYIINADGSQGTKATSEFKDVLEFANLASFPTTGETGKIYLALDTNKTYRWSGSAYVQIGGSVEEIWNTSRYANWRILKAEALGGNQAAITFTNSLGFINTGTATNKNSTYSTGNFIDTIRRIGLTSAATAGATVQRRVTSGTSCSTKSGFYFCADTISEDAATVATAADLVGLGNTFASPFGNVEPSTTPACVLLAYDSTDTNMQIMHNDNTGTCTKVDLGANFPARTNATDLYRLELFCEANVAEINYRVTRLNTGHQVSGTLTTNIPTSAVALTLGFWRGNRTTALTVTKSLSQITIATPY